MGPFYFITSTGNQGLPRANSLLSRRKIEKVTTDKMAFHLMDVNVLLENMCLTDPNHYKDSKNDDFPCAEKKRNCFWWRATIAGTAHAWLSYLAKTTTAFILVSFLFTSDIYHRKTRYLLIVNNVNTAFLPESWKCRSARDRFQTNTPYVWQTMHFMDVIFQRRWVRKIQ